VGKDRNLGERRESLRAVLYVVLAVALVVAATPGRAANAQSPAEEAALRAPTIEVMAPGPPAELGPVSAPDAKAPHLTAPIDLSFAGVADTRIPSDGALAVGPAHLLEVVNSTVGVFSKTGAVLQTKTLPQFFSTATTSRMGDARALYDSLSQRWLVLAFEVNFSQRTSRLWLAISQGPDPTGSFCTYTKDQSISQGVTGQVLADFPSLGIDDFALSVTMTRFSFATEAPVDVRLEVLPRSSLACGLSGLTTFVWTLNERFPDGRGVWSVQPTIALTPADAAYFVTTSWDGGTYAGIWKTSHAATPMLEMSYLAIDNYALTRNYTRQLGSQVPLDNGDTRQNGPAVYRNGSLYFAFSVESPTLDSAIRWYELKATTRIRVQQGVMHVAGIDYAYPSIMSDSAGGLVIVASQAGPNAYPNGVVFTRSASDPLGTFGGVQVFTTGSSPFEARLTSTDAARWGDYFGIALDPDGQRVWFESTYATSVSSWATRIGVTRPSPQAAPVPVGTYSVSIVTGQSTTSPATSPMAGSTVTVSAQLKDAAGASLAVAGRVVTWSASGGAGTFASPTSTTNAQGIATNSYQFSTAPGTYTFSVVDNLGARGSSNLVATTPRQLTTSVYLPNITKTLGGPDGWYTPFIVQNTGSTNTDLEIEFKRFTDGAVVSLIKASALAPGASFAVQPNNEVGLAGNTQFSVVVRSYGSSIVSVVNQHQGSGDRAEALSYVGSSTGATTVLLPNIVRRFFGYHTPFIMQNLGSTTTTVSAKFVPFDGGPAVTSVRNIQPGQSQFIEPNVEPGLVDGKQYAVTVTSGQPVAVVVNTHNDDANVASPVAYSANGITASGIGQTLYGAYAARGANNGSRTNTFTTIVVQNAGTTPVTPALSFRALAVAGAPKTITRATPLAPGASWAFDPRYTNGDTTRPLCTAPTDGCLADGEYSFTVTATGPVAAVVNVINPTSAMGYTTSARTSVRYFLPNVTRSLGGPSGWTTPIFLQSATATSALLTWKSLKTGTAITQTINLAGGGGLRVDPRSVNGLSEDSQYAVTIDGKIGAAAGTLNAIVMELADGGDNAMIYEGFPDPSAIPAP